MSTQNDAANFNDILLGFERTLQLETLAELGRQTNMVQVDVLACFVDIHGFTKFVQEDESVVPEFLREFFLLFPKAVLRAAWDLEPEPQEAATDFQARVRKRIIPTLSKKMGNGVLLVWEVDKKIEYQVKQGLRYAILDIVGYIQEYFYRLIKKKRDSFPSLCWDMHLAVGLAAGQAWRHDSEFGGRVDYSGQPLNLALRLQDIARPNGICVHGRFETNYLLERSWAGEGHINPGERLNNVDYTVPVWRTDKTLWLRKPRRLQGVDLSSLKSVLKPPYFKETREPEDEYTRRGLGVDDLRTLLHIREDLEVSFAVVAAAKKVYSAGILDPLIAEMMRIVVAGNADAGRRFRDCGQEFHEAIASLSGTNPKEADEHSALIRSLHEHTTKNKDYPQASSDLMEMLNEHREIAEAIKAGDQERAKASMQVHLESHRKRVIAKAFGSP